ncbi:hypothetical protein ILYODFUR_038039 [Ilyodon furcidens]|uniref:Uncharacterized protein n=1 Tax=Ilyodon furcidens TaxID=33524 RepID=A0ABV0UYR8_9TELE
MTHSCPVNRFSYPSVGFLQLLHSILLAQLVSLGGYHVLLSRLFRSCLYFFLSCLFFHTVVVLYGAPLIDSALETFSLAVLLTSLTTLRCLCVLGPNVQAWIRVFSRHGWALKPFFPLLSDFLLYIRITPFSSALCLSSELCLFGTPVCRLQWPAP